MIPDPGPIQNLTEPVSPGDEFTATVTSPAPGSYELSIADHTQGWSRRLPETEAGATNSSAEAIVEAPTDALPHFGAVSFRGVDVNGRELAAATPDQWNVIDAQGTREDRTSPIGSDGASFHVRCFTR
jgi:hypothetical protein